jgi:hypothetical protein
MEDGFDVVASRIQQERCVVAGMVLADTWGTVVATTMLEARFVEGIHRGAVVGLEGQVMSASQLALGCSTLWCRDKELIGPEIIGCVARHWNIEHCKYGSIESATALNVRDDKLNVVDQATPVEFLCFHIALPNIEVPNEPVKGARVPDEERWGGNPVSQSLPHRETSTGAH